MDDLLTLRLQHALIAWLSEAEVSAQDTCVHVLLSCVHPNYLIFRRNPACWLSSFGLIDVLARETVQVCGLTVSRKLFFVKFVSHGLDLGAIASWVWGLESIILVDISHLLGESFNLGSIHEVSVNST